MDNVVKLRGFQRETLESFRHEPDGVWHFWATVYGASDKEVSESLQRLSPEDFDHYMQGELSLVVVKLTAYVDPVELGASLSEPVWVRGKTVEHGQVRTEGVPFLQGSFIHSLKIRAIQNSMVHLSEVMGKLGIYDARDELDRCAGLR